MPFYGTEVAFCVLLCKKLLTHSFT